MHGPVVPLMARLRANQNLGKCCLRFSFSLVHNSQINQLTESPKVSSSFAFEVRYVKRAQELRQRARDGTQGKPWPWNFNFECMVHRKRKQPNMLCVSKQD